MSDTSAIDEKKNANNSNSTTTNVISSIQSFLVSLITIILIILLYFSSSSLILFVCKLAQTNILPTESNCVPYEDAVPNIQPIKTNIFTTFTDPEMSMKLEIPYDSKNTKNIMLDMFKEYKDKPSSNPLANYFISITESLLQFDYSTINTIMNFLNSMPEALIIGLGPIIVAFLFAFGVLINGLYFIYLWFANMYWFFKKNTNESGDGKPKWSNVTILTRIDWWIAIGLVILFIIIFFIGFPLISFIPFVALFYSCFSCLFYKGSLNGKSITSFSLIIEVLKYYKITIVSIISLFVVSLAFSNLGTIPGIFSIITLGLIYWGIISINIFKPISETNLSPSVSYDQAKKTCNNVKTGKQSHGLLYNILIGQNGGNNIKKELKKIGKNLSNV